MNIPQQIDCLNANAQEIKVKGKQLIDIGNQLALADAEYKDSEASAIDKAFVKAMTISKIPLYIKTATRPQKKKFENLQYQYKGLKSEIEILIEINNNFKLNLKLQGLKIKQLSNPYNQ